MSAASSNTCVKAEDSTGDELAHQYAAAVDPIMNPRHSTTGSAFSKLRDDSVYMVNGMSQSTHGQPLVRFDRRTQPPARGQDSWLSDYDKEDDIADKIPDSRHRDSNNLSYPSLPNIDRHRRRTTYADSNSERYLERQRRAYTGTSRPIRRPTADIPHHVERNMRHRDYVERQDGPRYNEYRTLSFDDDLSRGEIKEEERRAEKKHLELRLQLEMEKERRRTDKEAQWAARERSRIEEDVMRNLDAIRRSEDESKQQAAVERSRVEQETREKIEAESRAKEDEARRMERIEQTIESRIEARRRFEDESKQQAAVERIRVEKELRRKIEAEKRWEDEAKQQAAEVRSRIKKEVMEEIETEGKATCHVARRDEQLARLAHERLLQSVDAISEIVRKTKQAQATTATQHANANATASFATGLKPQRPAAMRQQAPEPPSITDPSDWPHAAVSSAVSEASDTSSPSEWRRRQWQHQQENWARMEQDIWAYVTAAVTDALDTIYVAGSNAPHMRSSVPQQRRRQWSANTTGDGTGDELSGSNWETPDSSFKADRQALAPAMSTRQAKMGLFRSSRRNGPEVSQQTTLKPKMERTQTSSSSRPPAKLGEDAAKSETAGSIKPPKPVAGHHLGLSANLIATDDDDATPVKVSFRVPLDRRKGQVSLAKTGTWLTGKADPPSIPDGLDTPSRDARKRNRD
ncbi:hypothetical protein CDD82_6807 [Ophiocordyceps australis]|uniref:Uncharacterized protein n=1 Tax=Ophiocordyceps australis TaxID=1399860 RepID=A0A2C5YTY6_9HYPO|nr:hypothetical protein CDD82_6807 [Ophiocordyceps australis]